MNIQRIFRHIAALALSTLAVNLPFAAQQPSQPAAAAASLPVFDVVSIRPNNSGSFSSSVRWGGDAFRATNTTLNSLLMNAYNIRTDLMSGLPGWANSTAFDINAKVSDPDPNALKNLSRDQRRAMVLAFLKDRFHLRAHIEVKTLPVYDLVIAKGGLKLKENNTLPSKDLGPGHKAGDLPPGSFRVSGTESGSELVGVAIPFSLLAPNLAFQVERNIIDKTGLTGRYDVDLKWSSADQEGKTQGLTDNPAPDIFTALQEQLGLKLEPSKGPVETLVVDHVEMPTAN